jgi:hypothetical protein
MANAEGQGVGLAVERARAPAPARGRRGARRADAASSVHRSTTAVRARNRRASLRTQYATRPRTPAPRHQASRVLMGAGDSRLGCSDCRTLIPESSRYTAYG